MPDRRWNRTQLAEGVAADIPDGWYVNLGIGMPTLVADAVPVDREIVIHSENGILGVGPPPVGNVDPDVIDAGKNPVTLVRGGCYMSHCDSFALIRGGHLDLAVLGAFQVSFAGDLANWSGPGDTAPAVGGAMDLAVGAKRIWAMMNLLAPDGSPRLLPACTYPLTGLGVVDRVYTDVAVFQLEEGSVHIRMCHPDVDRGYVHRLIHTEPA